MTRCNRSSGIAGAVLLVLGVAVAAWGLPKCLSYNPQLRGSYELAFAGQSITARRVPSHLVLQSGNLILLPIELLELRLGVGGQRFSVDRFVATSSDTVSFAGRPGLLLSYGLSVYSPRTPVVPLRAAAGVHHASFSSADRGFAYRSRLVSPWAGVEFSAHRQAVFGAGWRGQYLSGTMGADSLSGHAFGTVDPTRWYVDARFYSANKQFFSRIRFDVGARYNGGLFTQMEQAALAVEGGADLMPDAVRDALRGRFRSNAAELTRMRAKAREMREEVAEQTRKTAAGSSGGRQ